MTYKNNPKETFKDVTIEDVKKCKSFENISNELAQKIADAIRAYRKLFIAATLIKIPRTANQLQQ